VAERLSDGKAVNLAELALDLGYFDQAHFVKDFGAIVGVAPAEYARGVRSSFRS
jgi:AraC-like DNA-binding protein